MSFFNSVYSGIKAARKNSIPHYHYENLTYTPYLYDTPWLNHLYKKADDEQKMMIHDYLNDRFDVSELGDYADLNEKIEKDLKIGSFEKVIPSSHFEKRSRNLKGGGWDDDNGNFPF